MVEVTTYFKPHQDPSQTPKPAGLRRTGMKRGRRKTRTVEEVEIYRNNQIAAFGYGRVPCQATGLHHPDCPGWANVPHHRLERRDGGTDARENLCPVWGDSSLLDGCHGMIHRAKNKIDAVELGLLILPGPEKWVVRR